MDYSALIGQLLKLFGPVVLNLVTQHQAETGQVPTSAELDARIDTHVATMTAKGQAAKDAVDGK